MESVWFRAARTGNLSTIQALVQQPKLDPNTQFNVNAQDDIGDTALMWAASHGELEIIKYLVENKADMNIRDNEGLTALMYAIQNDESKVASYLISKKADLNIKDNGGNNALMNACQKKNLPIVRSILKNKNININEVNNYGSSALLFACTAMEFTGDYAKDTEIVKLLVAKGINIKLENKGGRTALYEAVKSEKNDVIHFLLLCGAEVTEKIINASPNKTVKDLLLSWTKEEEI